MLSDKELQGIRPNARPDGSYTDKPYKIGYGKGLFILINPNGRKYWRFKYQFSGKEKGLSLGMFPAVSIESARIKRDQLRALLAEHIDPSSVRKKHKAESLLADDALKLESRFLFSDSGNLMIKLANREMILKPEEARDLKKFLNTYPADEVE